MTYTEGNIVEVFKKYKGKCCLLHQANCNFSNPNRHGAGVALAIAKKFPEMVSAENFLISTEPKSFYFGGMSHYKESDNKYIINLFSQINFGAPRGTFDECIIYGSTEEVFKSPFNSDKDSFSERIFALEKALSKFKLKFKNEYKLFIPLIASGLAKHKDKIAMSDLDYFNEFILPVIKNSLALYDVDIVIFNK